MDNPNDTSRIDMPHTDELTHAAATIPSPLGRLLQAIAAAEADGHQRGMTDAEQWRWSPVVIRAKKLCRELNRGTAIDSPHNPPANPVAVHLAELVHELTEQTEELIRAGHMGELPGADPAEVDRFVQRLRAVWLEETESPLPVLTHIQAKYLAHESSQGDR
jgi:hypothetical protein